MQKTDVMPGAKVLALAVVGVVGLAGCGGGAGAAGSGDQAGARGAAATTSGTPTATTAPDADATDADAGESGSGQVEGVPANVACPAQAKAITVPSAAAGVPLPSGTLIVHSEVRSGGRLVLTGVVPADEPSALKDLQAAFAKAGLTLTEGEREARDAESNFEGDGITGRWGIRQLDGCPAPATRIDLVVKQES